jgi:hypothetical protein
VNLRYIVPALGLAALSTSSFAADMMPAVSFSGWVDAVAQYSVDDDPKTDNTATAKDDTAGDFRFTGMASIKANVQVTDTLSGKINLWFDPGSANVMMREAYWNWGFADGFSWQMGKYIDHLGWISAEPTGSTFLFINAGTIGYTAPYGNDVLGTALNFAPMGSPFSGSIHVTNGYYTGSDANSSGYSSPNSGNRENTDLGYGLDLNFNLPDDLGNINAELAYDTHSGDTAYLGGPNTNNPGANDLGGNVLMAGLNATIMPTSIVTIGAEVIYLTVDDGEDANGVDVVNGIDRLQGLFLVNVALEGAPIPMSISGLVQFVSIDYNAVALTETEDRMYVGVTLLTNPLTTTDFGLNYEIGYFDISGQNGTVGPAGENDGFTAAVEGIISF